MQFDKENCVEAILIKNIEGKMITDVMEFMEENDICVDSKDEKEYNFDINLE